MGLLYQFPVHDTEKDFIEKDEQSVMLKSYGLPWIFWIYYFAITGILVIMFFAIRDPLLRLSELNGGEDQVLAYALFSSLLVLPICLLGFFFYEKRISTSKEDIYIEHYVFRFKFLSYSYQLGRSDYFYIESFIDSPNMARLQGDETKRGFMNKGYFQLFLKQNDRSHLIDRSSRKIDLKKMVSLLNLESKLKEKT